MNTLGGLITGGLGLPAGQYMLTMHFHLFPMQVIITSAIGGSKPLAPGEIKTFYKPVPEQWYTKLPPYKELELLRKKRIVNITVKITEYKVEKEYVVSEKTFNMLVKINKVVDSTKNKMKFFINKIRKVTENISIKINKLKLKKNK